MRFTPSIQWLIAQESAHRRISWTVEVKKTTSLSEALNTGTWIDITRYVGDTFFPIRQQIEFEVGQFTSDSITLTASSIAPPSLPSVSAVQWFKNNIFNAAENEYLEIRIKATIRVGENIITTDTFYAFSGFIDKSNVEYDELNDTVTFTAYTADEIGNRLSAESITTQYINTDVDGAGTDGLILPNIPGIYVTNANIASYVLKKGTHIIEYEYNGGTEQARLDEGEWVTLPTTDGTATLTNKNADEKITIYVRSSSPSQLSTSSATLVDYIVVTTPGDVLPKQPYYGLGLRQVIKALYNTIGITDITCDTLQFQSHDGNAKFSYYDIPPEDISKTGQIRACANDGTNLYIAVGDTVYKRDMTAETTSTMLSSAYTALTTKATYTVMRMWYNARNNDLWIAYLNGTTRYIRIYHLNTDTYNEVNIPAGSDFTSADLMDYNYFGSNYKYGLVYTVVNTSVRFVDASATDTLLFTATDLGYGAGDGPLGIYLFVSDNSAYFQTRDGAGTYYHRIYFSSPDWVDGGKTATLTDLYSTDYPAMLHVSEGRIYYGYVSGGTLYVKSHTLTSGVPTNISAIPFSQYRIGAMIYANAKVYYINGGALYSLSSNSLTTEYDGEGGPEDNYPYAITYLNSILYGVDITRHLWRYSSTLNMHIKQAYWVGVSVKEAIAEVLKSYNLIGIISSHKKAFIYRRGNDSGAIQTTGNNLTINKQNCVDIKQIANAWQKVDWVEVTNGVKTYSYDGSTYNAKVFSDAKILTLSNNLIPDALVKDVAKYLFSFYNQNHDVYQFTLNTAPMQYEVMDGASVTLSDTRIQKTGTGLIQACEFDQFGNMKVEVLF